MYLASEAVHTMANDHLDIFCDARSHRADVVHSECECPDSFAWTIDDATYWAILTPCA